MNSKFPNFKFALNSLKYFRFGSMFYKVFAVTISIMLIVSIVNYIGIMYLKNMLTQNEIKSQNVYLENISLYIDNMLISINDVIYYIENDNDLKRVSQIQDMDSYEFYRVITNIKNKLSVFNVILKEVVNIYIYLDKPDIIIDPAGLNYAQSYYNNRYEDSIDAWYELFKQKHDFLIDIWKNKIKEDAVQKTSRINVSRTLMNGNIPIGTVVVNIDEAFISGLLVNREFAVGRNIYMVNGSGRIISSNTTDENENLLDIKLNNISNIERGNYFTQGDCLVTYKKSSVSNIYYIINTPKEVFLEQVTKLSSVAIVVITLFLIFGIFFTFLLSQRLYFPIGNVLEFFNTYSKMASELDININEMDYIRNRIINIVSMNKDLEDKMKEGIPLMIDIILLKIIMGEHEISNAISIMNQYNIRFAQGFYRVSIITINSHKKGAIIWNKENASLLKNLIKKYLDIYVLSIIKTAEYQYTVITFNSTFEDESKIKQAFIDILDELAALEHDNIYISIGQASSDIFEINKSYKQALNALNS